MPLQRSASLLVLGIVLTIPLIFGAIHPIVHGVYASLMLVGCGGWLLLSSPAAAPVDTKGLPSFWLILPLLLIGWIIVQSVPLPLAVIEILSPARADRIDMVNELAGTNVGWATLSDSGPTGIYRSFFLFGLLLYYKTITRLCATEPRFLKTLIFCIAAIGAFEAVYGILQFLRPNLGILWLKAPAGRAAYGTIIYKNQFASMLNMLWPLSLTSGMLYLLTGPGRTDFVGRIFRTSKEQTVLLVFSAALMTLAVLLSLSRGGILSMLLVALLLTLLLPFSGKGKVKFLVAFSAVICGYIFLVGADTLISRFDTIGGSGATRFAIYRNSLPMAVDHFLTGIGLGSYQLLSPIYLKGFPETTHVYRAHNEYLELTIELGVIAAGLLFCWIGAGMTTLFIRLRRAVHTSDADIVRTALSITSLCALAGFLAHGAVDFGWRLPVNLIYATTLLAIATSCLRQVEAPPTTKEKRR